MPAKRPSASQQEPSPPQEVCVCMYYGERFNAWTHLVGAVLACIGAIWLIVVAGLQGDPWKIVSFSIYGSTLLLLYSISTLYHSTRGRAKVIMRKLDHLSIYLLIAGSYTPFCLVSLRGPWGWSLFGVVWGLAVIGHVAGDQATFRSAHPVDHHLCGDGLDRAGGCQAIAALARQRRLCLAGCRRGVLHRRHHFLRLRQPLPPLAWHLASVRDSPVASCTSWRCRSTCDS
ncbi:hemolysin III family channel protein [Pseudomonas putida S11]|nr:hemolysin III family channel protein [Pseudomonas putida S11]